jgi:hypothetical protein
MDMVRIISTMTRVAPSESVDDIGDSDGGVYGGDDHLQ